MSLWVVIAAGIVTPARLLGQPSCRHLGIMVNPKNPVESLSFSELRKVYSGERRRWPHGEKLLVIAAKRDLELAKLFGRQLLGSSPRSDRLPENALPFHPLELSESGAKAYVRLFSNAIAYGWLDEGVSGVKWLEVEGLSSLEDPDCRPVAPDKDSPP